MALLPKPETKTVYTVCYLIKEKQVKQKRRSGVLTGPAAFFLDERQTHLLTQNLLNRLKATKPLPEDMYTHRYTKVLYTP